LGYVIMSALQVYDVISNPLDPKQTPA